MGHESRARVTRKGMRIVARRRNPASTSLVSKLRSVPFVPSTPLVAPITDWVRPQKKWYSRWISSLGYHLGTMHKLGGFLLVYKNKKTGK